MKNVITAAEAALKIKTGMSVMIGGFMCNGSPHDIIDAILDGNSGELTVICNDAGFPGQGVGKLIAEGRVKKLIASHIGMNPQAGQKMNSGEMEIELVPQGTLAERVRAGGCGLGGILTPTGVGTPVEEGKEKLVLDGTSYLLEKPLRADIALISGYQADLYGNVYYRGSARNFNPLMATATDIVILEADQIVQEIKPESVHTPGLFIDLIVCKGD